MQKSDGNLVMHNQEEGKVLWSSETPKHAGDYLILQKADGNLVLYDGKKSVWESGDNLGATKAVLTADCELVVQDETGATLWSTGTDCSGPKPTPEPTPKPTPVPTPIPTPVPPSPSHDTLPAAGTLQSGEKLVSASGKAHLMMETKGNLVLYHGDSSVWSSKTSGHSGAYLVFQASGPKLVIRGTDKSSLWSSQKVAGGTKLVLHDDDLVITDESGKVLASVLKMTSAAFVQV